MNLLTETITKLERNGKSPADVEWVGVKGKFGGYYTWDEFAERAKSIDYDDGYGLPEINQNLIVMGKDFWLERREYDGAEWWEYMTVPTKPLRRLNEFYID